MCCFFSFRFFSFFFLRSFVGSSTFGERISEGNKPFFSFYLKLQCHGKVIPKIILPSIFFDISSCTDPIFFHLLPPFSVVFISSKFSRPLSRHNFTPFARLPVVLDCAFPPLSSPSLFSYSLALFILSFSFSPFLSFVLFS